MHCAYFKVVEFSCPRHRNSIEYGSCGVMEVETGNIVLELKVPKGCELEENLISIGKSEPVRGNGHLKVVWNDLHVRGCPRVAVVERDVTGCRMMQVRSELRNQFVVEVSKLKNEWLAQHCGS